MMIWMAMTNRSKANLAVDRVLLASRIAWIILWWDNNSPTTITTKTIKPSKVSSSWLLSKVSQTAKAINQWINNSQWWVRTTSTFWAITECKITKTMETTFNSMEAKISSNSRTSPLAPFWETMVTRTRIETKTIWVRLIRMTRVSAVTYCRILRITKARIRLSSCFKKYNSNWKPTCRIAPPISKITGSWPHWLVPGHPC